ncbi:hypothetical protein [Anabaena lutea]|uniref:Uncharacterized protein n=1 Tax=Anabaena lutea FACHB-196 TaxID=2692881 RepID=A0ABR8FIP2_9NOST|nr:hypothetical protein [Anabaena lutea]MBD2570031.1 hypothetical protein [Anabaena lutea FACHB-196]
MLAETPALCFQELRNHCHQYFRYLPYLNLEHFNNPDVGWLHEVFGDICRRLDGNEANFLGIDLMNAFYSVVYELEFKQIFHPNSLVVHKSEVFKKSPKLSRIVRFSHDYPSVVVRNYNGSFLLGEPCLKTLTNYNLVLLKDTLA